MSASYVQVQVEGDDNIASQPSPTPESPIQYSDIEMTLSSRPIMMTRRFSNADFSTSEDEALAEAIFETWDTDHDGMVSAKDLDLPNVDPKFQEALARVLGFRSNGQITRFLLVECISVLKHGDLASKVKLLMEFMDSDHNGIISADEVKLYLRAADDRMLTRIGFTLQNGERRNLSYEDILCLFQQDPVRGNEAIQIFCDQIIRVLESVAPTFHLPRAQSSRRRHSITSFTLEQVPVSCNWYDHIVEQFGRVSEVQWFKFALVLLQIFLWLFYFFYHRSRDYPLSFCFAKGFGLNLRILTLLVYFTMARTTLGQLYSFRVLRPLIPLGINIEVHSFIGFSIFMHAFGHTFGHIAYKQMETSGFQTAFTQNSLLRGADWETKLKGDGKTGMLLLAFVIIMAVTALYRSFSSYNYKLFVFCHFMYILYLPMIFLHMPQLWPYFLAITALIVGERLVDLLQSTLYTTLAASRPCANGITFLSIPRYGMQTYPGSYYRIRIPALSYEWHPFSLAGNTSSHHLFFFIASAGDWTRALHELVQDPQKRMTTLVQVQGPFLAPASQALIRKPRATILCVASGIGITPFFSLMATKVSDEVNYENDRVMYAALFQETSFKVKASNAQSNSLLQVLQDRWKATNASSTPPGTLVNVSRDNSSSSLITGLTNIIAPRRNTGSTAQLTLAALNSQSQSAEDNTTTNNSNNGIASTSNGADGNHSNGSSHSINGTTADAGAPTTAATVAAAATAMPTATAEAKVDQHSIPLVEDDDDEDDSLLKVVWSIREASELSFYLDYVHHLVKSQEHLRPFGDEEQGRPGSKKPHKSRVVVEVEVYLTGLGNKLDPAFMLSQTLFLLSMAQTSSAYMKVHFGRPNLDKIVRDVKPEEVYYCGGHALKTKLNEVCHHLHIPFHPEDFDAGGGEFVRGVQSGAQKALQTCGLRPKPAPKTPKREHAQK